MPVVKPFSTIAEMFDVITRHFIDSDKPAYLYKVAGVYKPLSYKELREMVELTACGLAALGLNKGDKFGIISENRIEWIIVDFAMTTTGFITTPSKSESMSEFNLLTISPSKFELKNSNSTLGNSLIKIPLISSSVKVP